MSRKRLGCRDLHETYLIDRFAGQGTYGAVHIGRDKETGAMVAIKHLKLARDEIDCFPLTNLREIKALRSLGNFRHQNIVNFIEVVTTKPSDDNRQLGDVYMVFDAAEGDLEGLLDDWHEGILAPGCETGGEGDGGGGTSTRPSNAAPRRTPLPISLIRHLMHQLLSGLAFIHSHGYVHRDIKPANLLLNCDYSLRIADFGLVKKCTPGQKLTPGMCTPWWRAPEVLLSDSFTGPPMGPPIDVWSAGVVFTNMLFRSTRNSFHSHQQAIPALHSIWRICGAPDEKSWPGIRKFGVFLTALPSGNPPRDIYRKYGRLLVLNMIIDECSIPGDVGIFLVWGVLFAPQNFQTCPEGLDLLDQMLTLNPDKRITAEKALLHPFFLVAEAPLPTPFTLKSFFAKTFEEKDKGGVPVPQNQKPQLPVSTFGLNAPGLGGRDPPSALVAVIPSGSGGSPNRKRARQSGNNDAEGALCDTQSAPNSSTLSASLQRIQPQPSNPPPFSLASGGQSLSSNPPPHACAQHRLSSPPQPPQRPKVSLGLGVASFFPVGSIALKGLGGSKFAGTLGVARPQAHASVSASGALPAPATKSTTEREGLDA